MVSIGKLIVTAAVLCAAAAAQTCPPSADSFVRQALKQGDPFALGFGVQQARALGDCAAIALMRNLRLSDLNDPHMADMIVRTLTYAFSDPSYILIEQNRQPRAALLLLDILAEHSSDATARLNSRDLLQRLEALKPKPQETGPR